MSITVLDKEATGSLVLPSPPKVVSLADYDQLKVVLLRLPDPLIINPHRSPIKPPSPEPATRLFASRHAIRNRQIQVKWSHFVLRQALTTIWFDMRGKSHSPTAQTLSAFKMSHRGRIPTQKCWTQFTSRWELDIIIILNNHRIKPKCRVRCVAQAYSSEGKAGTPLKSLATPIASEGYCHNPLVSGPRAFQAQNFHTEMEYMDDDNTLRIKVEVPHEDGLLPIISTSRIHNIGNYDCSLIEQTVIICSPSDFLLRDEVFRQQHLCSNLLTPSEAPETNEGRGFCDNYEKDRIPQVPGYNLPHQVRVFRPL